MTAHDDAVPMMFEYRTKYFSYNLQNVLKLKSSNQIRMYELLKQYEKLAERTFTIVELKGLLGIEKDDYNRFGNLKKNVLDICKTALEQNTDIKYTYEPTGRRGRYGKFISLKFKVYKNENYTEPSSDTKSISSL